VPCYIHQLDKVEGSAHFEVEEKKGVSLAEHLRTILPGYGVPKYVKEVAGDLAKRPITELTSCS
jgi:L-lysine 2,3-aminomutase